MARNMRIASSGGGLRKFIGLLVLAGLVLWVINNPVGAAEVVATVVRGLVEFVKGLFSSR
jgi:hypothetical protein